MDFANRFKDLPQFRPDEEPVSPMHVNTPSAQELVGSYRKKRFTAAGAASKLDDLEPGTPNSVGPLSPKDATLRRLEKRMEGASSTSGTPSMVSPSLEGGMFFGNNFNLTAMTELLRNGNE